MEHDPGYFEGQLLTVEIMIYRQEFEAAAPILDDLAHNPEAPLWIGGAARFIIDEFQK